MPLTLETLRDHQSGQLFTHIDTDGTQRHFAATLMAQWAERFATKIQTPLRRADALLVACKRGVERHRIERLVALGSKFDLKAHPILYMQWPPDEHLLIDGSHRYVAAAVLDCPWIFAYEVPHAIGMQFEIKDPRLNYPDEESMLKSYSGVR